MKYLIKIDGKHIHMEGVIEGFYETVQVYNHIKEILDPYLAAEIKSIEEDK